MTSTGPSELRNAPWNTDDREVLRQKWRLADETASNCEQFLHKLELLRIRVEHVAEGTAEHDELAVEAKNMLFAVGQEVFGSELTTADWNWFVKNSFPDEPKHWNKLGEKCQQAENLGELFDLAEAHFRAISKARRKFADAIKLSLNAWEESDDSQASWYQRVDDGVRIHGKLVELRGRDAEVLEFLCKRTSRLSSYRDIAELHDTWSKGLDSGNDGAIKSTKSSIRTSVSKIRIALRSTFTLPADTDPLPRGKPSQSWKLDKDLLQTNSQ